MINLVALLFTFVIAGWLPLQASSEAQPKPIKWLTNYEEAVNQSKTSSKPIILFFTGSDWCPLCKKLEKEVFDTQEFATAAGDKYIFVLVDTPGDNPLPKAQAEQNSDLKKKYDIRMFPTVVIIDSQQKQIGVTSYKQGGGKAYAAHLEDIVNAYSKYHAKMVGLDKKKLSPAELKELYITSKKLGRLQDSLQIIHVGIESPDNQYFLIERYRFLADEGKIFDEDTVTLRKKILESDPNNEQFAHYQVAVIDFEAAWEEMEKENFSPEIAVAPLVAYVEKFGGQDKENLWRLEMIISQVYFDKGKLAEALKYAQASYDAAPSSAQSDIATAIKSIQSQLQQP